MNYAVGQVLYVILKKEASVYPMLVIKQVTETTLEGDTITYVLRAGANPEKTLALSEIDGEIFDSADKAKRVLTERVTASISQRVEQAVAKAKEWYPTGRELVSDDPLTLIKKPAKPAKPMRPELAELAAEMQAENEQTVIELPDGSKAKVRSVKVPPSMQD